MKQVEKQAPLVLLCLLVLKSMVVGTEYGEAIVMVGLIAFVALVHYLDKHKTIQDIAEDIKKQNEVMRHLVEKYDELKTSVASVKLSAGFKRNV
jgi:Na+/H+-translocating membrane pyrophosphatase